MRDYIGALRAIWRCWEKEEPLDYHSEHYTLTLMTANFSPRSMCLPMVPVSMAAVGPAMLRLAGEICDGVRLHPFCTGRYLKEFCLAHLSEGVARGGRERADLEVVGGGFIATGPDEAAVTSMLDHVRFRSNRDPEDQGVPLWHRPLDADDQRRKVWQEGDGDQDEDHADHVIREQRFQVSHQSKEAREHEKAASHCAAEISREN